MKDNQVLITGNLTKDPEVRYTPKGTPVVNARICIHENFLDRDGQRREVSTFVDIESWGDKAKLLGEQEKGSRISIDGLLRASQWEDPDGRKHSKLFVKAMDWQPAPLKARTQEVER